MQLTELASTELDWLRSRTDADGFAGYDANGWDESTWILHAMYENVDLPSDITYDDEARDTDPLVEVASGGCNAKLIGCPGGGSRWPGPGWERLAWNSLAQRQSLQLFSDGINPCFRTFRFPTLSWPLSIRPPAEGSLDWEQLETLVSRLSSHTEGGMSATCYAYYGSLVCRDWNDSGIYFCSLGDILTAYTSPHFYGTPSNLWPDDRSWMVYTDSDLWGTKVSGSRELIASLQEDELLETVRSGAHSPEVAT